MNIESITQALFALGYIDPNIEIAEQRLQDYRAGKMDAKSWDEVRTQIFG
jgi:hypothetical protein